MAEIVITEFMDGAAVERLKALHETLYDPALADRQGEIPALVSRCRALIVRNRTRVSGELMTAAPKLQAIGRLGVGLDNIDLDAARARGIAVMPASGANNLSVAEYVISAALLLLRGAYLSTPQMTAGSWPRTAMIGREMSGKVLGLVGYGAIARATALKASALGMHVMAHDPLLPVGDAAWRGAQRSSLDDLLARSDAVSLHVPLSPSTRRMIGAAALGKMKPDAVLINAARGGVVDEDALAVALRAGRLGGAALDVFEEEPLGPEAGARFAGLANVVLTPHIAGVTVESNARVSEMIADLILAKLGEHP